MNVLQKPCSNLQYTKKSIWRIVSPDAFFIFCDTFHNINNKYLILDGYEAAVKETERITEEKVELDEYEKESLDKRLFIIKEHLSEKPIVTITYFKKDEYKEGGSYPMITGVMRKIDNFQKILIMESGEIISINDIVDMDSVFFRELL